MVHLTRPSLRICMEALIEEREKLAAKHGHEGKRANLTKDINRLADEIGIPHPTSPSTGFYLKPWNHRSADPLGNTIRRFTRSS